MANSGSRPAPAASSSSSTATRQLAPAYTVLGTITEGLDIVEDVAKAGDDGAFAQQAGGGHPKKEVVINDLTMSNPQG